MNEKINQNLLGGGLAYCFSYLMKSKEEEFRWSDVIKNSTQITSEPIQRYLLNTVKENLEEDGLVRRYTFGRNYHERRNRTILMMGETGSGKSTLINRMLNYMLGVKWEDNIRFEITPEEVKRPQTQSQTKPITAYEILGLDELPVPFSLTVIDTPGFGDTRGLENYKEIVHNLDTLLKSARGIEEIDAVCLVVKASENRFSPSRKYIFDAILSIFGKNMEKNIMTLITFSNWTPPSALNAVIVSGVPFPRDGNNEPVHFLFNNLPFEKPDEEYEETYKTDWDKGTRSFRKFFQALDEMEIQNMRMSKNFIQERWRLEACIQSLEGLIKVQEMKRRAHQETLRTLEEHREDVKKNNYFQYKYKAIVTESVETWTKATSCTVCEMTCHDLACWWVSDNELQKCDVMRGGYCTVCPRKCSYKDHKKERRRYVPNRSRKNWNS